MSKLAFMIAAGIALASVGPVAFAATRAGTPVTRGAACDSCRRQLYPQGGADDHHKGPAIRACVERLENGLPAFD